MKKVLIANRGEIAVRIIRACHDLGLQTVAVYSKPDSEALHVLLADEAICIGDGPASSSYLKIPNILSACEITGADALHPGYGFLSENAHFASICESCGLTFVGPSSDAINMLGNKSQAKKTAKKAKCPIIPGTEGIVDNYDNAIKEAKKIGFPVFIKASAGGGGKGIRVAESEDDFARKFTAARTEAEAAFGNPDVYLEKMIVDPRHVEIQVVGDKHGNYVYLGERDCTIQRRRQKLIEETPSPLVSSSMRKKMGEAAVRILEAAKYSSAGTVEFLLDKDKHFYFMEANTRVQVEHTISEELTGVDIVKEQLLVAMGNKLSVRQKEVEFRGCSIQFRINAENPANNFMPSPGRLEYFIPPGGPNVRVDTACYSGYSIPPFYDSMIAKLIVNGKDRNEALANAKSVLTSFHIGPIHTTIPFHLYMLQDKKFVEGIDYTIGYIDQLIEDGATFELEPQE